MPYANHEQQLEAMRAWRQRRKVERSQAAAQVRQYATTPTLPSALPTPASLPRRPDRHTQDRRQLLRDYQVERTAGSDDTTALATALRRRTAQRAETAQERQRARYEREVQTLTPLFVPEARRRLSMGGFYSESDVLPVAKQLAAHHVKHRQTPRLPDPEPKRLAVPVYRPAPEQQAGRVWMGRFAPARLSLGDGYAAQREVSRSMVQALLATLLRQPAAAVAQTVETTMLPVSPVGVPEALGAPVAGESGEWEE
jgi:hypothetical protein